MSSVPMIILWVSRVGREVIAMHIVDISISIVIDIVRWNFSWVRPGVGGEVWVIVRDPCINDHREGGIATGGDIPCVRQIEGERSVHRRILRIVWRSAGENRVVRRTGLVPRNLCEHPPNLRAFTLIA